LPSGTLGEDQRQTGAGQDLHLPPVFADKARKSVLRCRSGWRSKARRSESNETVSGPVRSDRQDPDDCPISSRCADGKTLLGLNGDRARNRIIFLGRPRAFLSTIADQRRSTYVPREYMRRLGSPTLRWSESRTRTLFQKAVVNAMTLDHDQDRHRVRPQTIFSKRTT